MLIKNNKILVLGGWGLVGMAVCRELLLQEPDEIFVHSLVEKEAEEACENLKKETKNSQTKFTPVWGNIFVNEALKGLPKNEIINNKENRKIIIDEIYKDLTPELLEKSSLYKLLLKTKPNVVIDCINTATALAYQNVFLSSSIVKETLDKSSETEKIKEETEKLLMSIYTPQLIRHVQIFYEGMREVKTSFYVKVGTSGTGGMGLNIPYTHSEEKPSRVLLAKTAVAGAHSLLLFLMARTPDAPVTKEIKPTAAIAWKKIAYGEIKKGGQPVKLYDCTKEQALDLSSGIYSKAGFKGKELGENLKSVYIDTGENGIFSRGEFTTISSLGQMEFITPEEIARNVVFEILGRNTGSDVISALDNSSLGPTYRAGYLRQSALLKMKELESQHKVRSIAFELLGPPKLSKLLYEAYFLEKVCTTLENVANANTKELTEQLEKLVLENQQLRSEPISIGIPILLNDGKTLLRGPEIKIPVLQTEKELNFTSKELEKWSHEGWIDLQEKNVKLWQERAKQIISEAEKMAGSEMGSRFNRNEKFWKAEKEINVGKLASWIFESEEHGFRIKE
ncbi:short-chain dehydrogenase [bacterium]|nr:short-chain dehydrogenase [bacterium]